MICGVLGWGGVGYGLLVLGPRAAGRSARLSTYLKFVSVISPTPWQIWFVRDRVYMPTER